MLYNVLGKKYYITVSTFHCTSFRYSNQDKLKIQFSIFHFYKESQINHVWLSFPSWSSTYNLHIYSTWNFLNLLPSSMALTYKEIFLAFGWIHFHSKTLFQLKALMYTLDSDNNNQILRFIRWQGSEYLVI